MTGAQSENGDNSRPTLAGCLLLVVSLAVIVVVALPVAAWRDPETGVPLPREVAIVAPVLAGALCCGIGTGLLRILGLPVLVKPRKDSSDSPANVETSERDKQTGADQPP